MFGSPMRVAQRRILPMMICLLLNVPVFAQDRSPTIVFSGINWITIWLAFLFGVLFTMLFRYLDKTSHAFDQRRDAARPLSGLILFLGFNLVVRVFVQLYFFFKARYFSYTLWKYLEENGGVQMHSLFIVELFLSLFALAGTGALLYWYLGRRDIFPRMFLYYVTFYVIINIALLLVYPTMPIPPEMRSLRHNVRLHMARTAYGSAWAIYILLSVRVRKTFVYPP